MRRARDADDLECALLRLPCGGAKGDGQPGPPQRGLWDTYSRRSATPSSEVVTGKPVVLGGAAGRRDATGLGVVQGSPLKRLLLGPVASRLATQLRPKHWGQRRPCTPPTALVKQCQKREAAPEEAFSWRVSDGTRTRDGLDHTTMGFTRSALR